MNTNFGDLEAFLNSTGVHVYQAGTVNAAALASNAVTTAKIADDAVTAAKIADGAITAAQVGLPSVVKSYLDNDISLLNNANAIITSSSHSWANVLDTNSSYADWDAVNKRPFAAATGLYLATATIIASTTSKPTTAVYLLHGILYKNTTEIARSTSGKVYETDTYITLSFCEVLSLTAGDYVSLTVDNLTDGGSYGTTVISDVGGVHNTRIGLQYIGPSS
jgi:hypothetical protein